MPFLSLDCSGLEYSGDASKPIVWQVDWSRPLGWEAQVTHLKRLTQIDRDLKGSGLDGYLLQAGAGGATLDLAKSPQELGLRAMGVVRVVKDPHYVPPAPAQPKSALKQKTSPTRGDAADGSADTLPLCTRRVADPSFGRPQAWHAVADAQLHDTTGRIPDWRGRLRQATRGSRDAVVDDQHSDEGRRPRNHLHFQDSRPESLKIPGLGGSPKLRGAPSQWAPPKQRDGDGYIVPTTTAHTEGGVLSLDHVPGFQMHDSVQVVADPTHPELHGEEGTVCGCELRGGILHVVVTLNSDPSRVVPLRVRYLQNMTQLSAQGASYLAAVSLPPPIYFPPNFSSRCCCL
eukprot:Rhum_TRINITY_DN12764_c0_g1::Rhum_TRINITY_DN12764_c0_g1_i1::g.54200::m.54200